MRTLAPTRTKKNAEAHINPREHGPRRGKLPLTQVGASEFRRRAGIEPPRSPRMKTSGDSTVATQEGPTGPRPLYTWRADNGANCDAGKTKVEGLQQRTRDEDRTQVRSLAARLGCIPQSGEHIDAQWRWFQQQSKALRCVNTDPRPKLYRQQCQWSESPPKEKRVHADRNH